MRPHDLLLAHWLTPRRLGHLPDHRRASSSLHSSPEHRAALSEVAANFPGVDYEGSVTDPAGRRGVSVSFEGGGNRRELIFDPDTAELLAERHVLLEQEEGLVIEDNTWPGDIIAFAGPRGKVVWWNVILH